MLLRLRVFLNIKHSLVPPPILPLYDLTWERKVNGNALSYGIGGVLHKPDSGN